MDYNHALSFSISDLLTRDLDTLTMVAKQAGIPSTDKLIIATNLANTLLNPFYSRTEVSANMKSIDTSNLTKLPDYLKIDIMEHLSPPNILSVCQASPELYQFCSSKIGKQFLCTKMSDIDEIKEACKGDLDNVHVFNLLKDYEKYKLQKWLRQVGINKTLEELQNLQELELSFKRLKSLPKEIGKIGRASCRERVYVLV